MIIIIYKIILLTENVNTTQREIFTTLVFSTADNNQIRLVLSDAIY
jgi:hypothetical protein